VKFRVGDPVFIRAPHVQCGTWGVVRQVKPGRRPYVVDGLGAFSAGELVRAN